MAEHHQIEEGDVVDHKVFGLGTVQSITGPLSSSQPASGSSYGVTVAWHDPDRQPTTVLNTFLRKVKSPETRPHVYWARLWEPLRGKWLEARREVEVILQTYDPPADEQKLSEAIKAEAAAWEEVKAFLASPRN